MERPRQVLPNEETEYIGPQYMVPTIICWRFTKKDWALKKDLSLDYLVIDLGSCPLEI